MAVITDEALLQQHVATQDADAFSRLVARYSNMVYTTCLRVTGNTHDAEDASQECFLSLARRAGTIRSSLPGWLHATARHASLEIAMKAQKRTQREASVPAVRKNVQEPTWEELEPHIDAAVQNLPEELQSPLVLHYFQGIPQSEIADIMGIDRSTVSRRLRKGVEGLRRRLKKAGVIVSVGALAICLGNSSAAGRRLPAAGPGGARARRHAAGRARRGRRCSAGWRHGPPWSGVRGCGAGGGYGLQGARRRSRSRPALPPQSQSRADRGVFSSASSRGLPPREQR